MSYAKHDGPHQFPVWERGVCYLCGGKAPEDLVGVGVPLTQLFVPPITRPATYDGKARRAGEEAA